MVYRYVSTSRITSVVFFSPSETSLLKRSQAASTTGFFVFSLYHLFKVYKPEVVRQKFQQVYEGHVQNGKTLQLIAINAHTDHRHRIDGVDVDEGQLLLWGGGGSLFEESDQSFFGGRGIDFRVVG